jgi:hypothetical protein
MKVLQIRFILLGFLFLTLASGSFAQKGDKKNKSSKRQSKSKQVSTVELRLRLSEFFIRYAEAVEASADQIYFEAEDPQIRRSALMWKIYGISAMSKAVNTSDQVAAFFDAWPFAKQSVGFFESGPGKEKLGPYHSIALDVSRKMENKLDSIIVEVAGMHDFEIAEPLVDQWARDNPIQDFYFTRESTLKFFAASLGEIKLGLGGNISNMSEQVVQLSNRLNMYADLIPRQARWQADFAIMNYLKDTASVMARIDRLLYSLEKVSDVVEMSPELIEYNRDATLREINHQRRETLALLQEERKAIGQFVTSEREEVLNILMQERLIVLNQLAEEREIALEEIRNLTSDVVVQSGMEAERIVDKIFWRTLIFLFILGAMGFIGVLMYKKL